MVRAAMRIFFTCVVVLLISASEAVQVKSKAHTRQSQQTQDSFSIDEIGYQVTAAAKDSVVMEAFVRELIKHFGGKVRQEAALMGMVPYYSGEKASQSYDQLLSEIQDAPWVDWSKANTSFMQDSKAALAERVDQRHTQLDEMAKTFRAPGAVAPLREDGYRSVAQLRCDAQMEMFIRRVVAAHNGKLQDSGGLLGLVPYFSGTTLTRSYGELIDELEHAPWILFYSRSQISEMGSNATLDDAGYQAVLRTASADQLELFVRRVVGARNATIKDEEAMHQHVLLYSKGAASTFQSLVEDLNGASWLEYFKPEEFKLRSSRYNSQSDLLKVQAMGFNEEGYQAVAALKNNGQMGSYVRRFLASNGATITDHDTFVKFLPYFSGTKQTRSFQDLLLALKHAKFVDWGGLHA